MVGPAGTPSFVRRPWKDIGNAPAEISAYAPRSLVARPTRVEVDTAQAFCYSTTHPVLSKIGCGVARKRTAKMIYVDYETLPTISAPLPWQRLETPHHVVFWIGHIYMDGLVSGRPTIERLARDLLQRSLPAIAAELRGVFGLLIFDKLAHTWAAMVDNAGMYKLYYDAHGICSSFLAMLRTSPSRPAIARKALVEYIAQGRLYGGATLIDGIYKISLDEIVEIRGPGHITKTTKILPRSAQYDRAIFLRHMENLLAACKGKKISIDITGGYDTRLLVVLFDSLGADYELAASGWRGATDVEIAQEIATALGRPLFVTWHSWTDLESELRQCFQAADGQVDPVHFHRDRMNAVARRARGVEIIVHGGGGGHYKDHFYIQDFPWYGSKRVRFERFYDLRVAPVSWPRDLLTAEAWSLVREAKELTLRRFEEHRASTNNESYDRAAFFVRDPEAYGGHLCAYTNMGLQVAAPFLDYHNMLMSFAIPPWSRFMTRWHRDLITEHNRRVAKIRTTDNYTASACSEDVLRNVIGYVGPQLRRAAKKVVQRAIGKNMFFNVGAPACDDPAFRPAVRRTALFAEAVERLKALGVLTSKVQPSDVREQHVQAVLNAGLLAERVEEEARRRRDETRREPVA